MTIGVIPGARTAGLLVVGAAGQGNCAATMSVPTATWIVDPFWAGVTVIVPCAMLGVGVGVGDGEGERDGEREGGVGVGGVLEDGALEVLPEPETESVGLPGAVPVPAP